MKFIRPIMPGVIFLCTIFFSCSYSSKETISLLNAAKDKQFDVIIVPGFQFDTPAWHPIVKARIYWSKYLFDKGIAKNIMFSGSAVYTPFVEAKIMALYAEAIGIPSANIFLETKAEHSTENIYYSWLKAKELGFKSIALATDPVQGNQLKRFVHKRINDDMPIIPIVFDTLRSMVPTMIDPKIQYETARVENFISIVDRESFWKRWQGTLGRNINYSN